MYHGAEHKCINCIEHGMELNVENVLKSSRWAVRDVSKSELVTAGLAARFASVMFLAEGYGENVPQD